MTIDPNDTDMDFSAPKSVQGTRTLLLAPPSIAAQEDKLRGLFTTYDRSITDLQMLDRLSSGLVSLPASTYDLVLILTDTDGARRPEAVKLLTRQVYTTLVPSMKPGAKLQTQDTVPLNASESMEVILAGLVQSDTGFEKPNFETTAVPLKLGLKKKNNPAPPAEDKTIPTGFAVPTQPNPTNHDRDDEDELINEDTLLTEEDLSRPIMPRMSARLHQKFTS